MRLEHLLSGEHWEVNQLDKQGRISKNTYSLYFSKKSLFGGLAQLARAPALHAGGQRFESVILHVKWNLRIDEASVTNVVNH